MELKQTPRIILRGDQEAAGHMAREGIRQLGILKNLMGFQNLKQDVRRVRFIDGSEIICRSIFGIDDVQVYVPLKKEKWTTSTIVPRFFAKVATGDHTTYAYFWIYFGDVIDVVSQRVKKGYIQPPPSKYNNNIVIVKISSNFERTKEEVERGSRFHSTLNQALTPFIKYSETDTSCFAVKSFMLEDDYVKDDEEKYIKERWVATNHYLFKARRAGINVKPKWTPPPPCDIGDVPCPPTKFVCDVDKKILIWYGTYEIFVGALVVRFDDLDRGEEIYTHTYNCVATSGSLIEAEPYQTLTGTKDDMPVNMISDIESVTDAEISFYLPRASGDRPGIVTIDWLDYEWGLTISALGVSETKHWYWSVDGFEQKVCAHFNQIDLDNGIVDKDETFYDTDCPCDSLTTQAECDACSEVMQSTGRYKRTVDTCLGYSSLYTIALLDELISASTLYRNIKIWEGKIYKAHECIWVESVMQCYYHSTIGYNAAQRDIGESIEQKHANGLSAFWNSNNVAYFSKEKNRNKCIGVASQLGKTCRSFTSDICTYWGGSNQCDFCKCCWPCDSPAHLCAEDCPSGLGKCFELEMPGGDWFSIGNDYVETIAGPRYKWHRNSNVDNYSEPFVRKFKIDEEIEFDATKVYKTYYLDDRATEETQGMIVAGKGVEEGIIHWEVYHEWVNEDNVVVRDDITQELFEKLNCEHWQLVEIGLI